DDEDAAKADLKSTKVADDDLAELELDDEELEAALDASDAPATKKKPDDRKAAEASRGELEEIEQISDEDGAAELVASKADDVAEEREQDEELDSHSSVEELDGEEDVDDDAEAEKTASAEAAKEDAEAEIKLDEAEVDEDSVGEDIEEESGAKGKKTKAPEDA